MHEVILIELNSILDVFPLLESISEASREDSSLDDLKLERGESSLGHENYSR